MALYDENKGKTNWAWWVVGIIVLVILAFLVFAKDEPVPVNDTPSVPAIEEMPVASTSSSTMPD